MNRTNRRIGDSMDSVVEWRQKLLNSLNKLEARDTQKTGVEEIVHMLDYVQPDTLPMFISCLLETSEAQKPSAKKESIRIMGIAASILRDGLQTHLTKIVTAISKRLKENDTFLRDQCADTIGLLAKYVTPRMDTSNGAASSSPLDVYFKPFFALLSEQNKQTQTGAAMCISKVIENSANYAILTLPQLVTRLLRYSKSPNCLAHSSMINCLSSLVDSVGDAIIPHVPSVMTHLMDGLASSDFTARKAASEALELLALKLGPSMMSFKSEVIEILEDLRFDKVKPVRDSVIHCIEIYRTLGVASPVAKRQTHKEESTVSFNTNNNTPSSARKSAYKRSMSSGSLTSIPFPLNAQSTPQKNDDSNFLNFEETNPKEIRHEIFVPSKPPPNMDFILPQNATQQSQFTQFNEQQTKTPFAPNTPQQSNMNNVNNLNNFTPSNLLSPTNSNPNSNIPQQIINPQNNNNNNNNNNNTSTFSRSNLNPNPNPNVQNTSGGFQPPINLRAQQQSYQDQTQTQTQPQPQFTPTRNANINPSQQTFTPQPTNNNNNNNNNYSQSQLFPSQIPNTGFQQPANYPPQPYQDVTTQPNPPNFPQNNLQNSTPQQHSNYQAIQNPNTPLSGAPTQYSNPNHPNVPFQAYSMPVPTLSQNHPVVGLPSQPININNIKSVNPFQQQEDNYNNHMTKNSSEYVLPQSPPSSIPTFSFPTESAIQQQAKTGLIMPKDVPTFITQRFQQTDQNFKEQKELINQIEQQQLEFDKKLEDQKTEFYSQLEEQMRVNASIFFQQQLAQKWEEFYTQISIVTDQHQNLMNMVETFMNETREGISNLSERVARMETTVNVIHTHYQSSVPSEDRYNSNSNSKNKNRKPRGSDQESEYESNEENDFSDEIEGDFDPIQSYLLVGHFKAAYENVLNSGNGLQLLRVLEKTGPVADRLEPALLEKLFLKFIQFLKAQTYVDLVLDWIAQCIQISLVPLQKPHIDKLLSVLQDLGATPNSSGIRAAQLHVSLKRLIIAWRTSDYNKEKGKS